jgi:hypothetical protein
VTGKRTPSGCRAVNDGERSGRSDPHISPRWVLYVDGSCSLLCATHGVDVHRHDECFDERMLRRVLHERSASSHHRFPRICVREAPSDVRVVQPLVRHEECGRRRVLSGRGVGRHAVRDADRVRDDIVSWLCSASRSRAARRWQPDNAGPSLLCCMSASRRRGAPTQLPHRALSKSGTEIDARASRKSSERQRCGDDRHEYKDGGDQRVTTKDIKVEGEEGSRNHDRQRDQSAQNVHRATCGGRKLRAHCLIAC